MPSEESMIQDLRELEAELREKEEYRKANIIDLFIRHSRHCKINKSVIREKIEWIDEEGYWEFTTDRDSDKAKELLQDLLKENKEKE